MAESDRPVTATELREQLTAALAEYPTRQEFKAELKAELTAALAEYPTRQEFKAELKAALTAALAEYPTRQEFNAGLKAALEPCASKEDLKALRDELRTHFDAARERFRDEFKWLHEWAEANSSSLALRVDAVEKGHGARLLALEARVTALESHRTRP